MLSAFLNGNAVYEKQVYTADGGGWCALSHGCHINRISLAPIESRAIERRYAPSHTHAHTHIYTVHIYSIKCNTVLLLKYTTSKQQQQEIYNTTHDCVSGSSN